MQLTQQRWTQLGEEIANILEKNPNLDIERIKALLQMLWDLDNREGSKEKLWGISLAKPNICQHLASRDLEELSAEERVLIVASCRVVARSLQGEMSSGSTR